MMWVWNFFFWLVLLGILLTLAIIFSKAAVSVMSLNHSTNSGLCGLFQLRNVSRAATIKPVIVSRSSALVRPGGIRALSANRHSCGDSGKGRLSHPPRFFSTTSQKGSTIEQSHMAWRNMPNSLWHFQHLLSWVNPILNNFSGVRSEEDPARVHYHREGADGEVMGDFAYCHG